MPTDLGLNCGFGQRLLTTMVLIMKGKIILLALLGGAASSFAQVTVFNATFENGMAADGFSVSHTQPTQHWNWVDLTYSSANWGTHYNRADNYVNASNNVAYASSDYYNRPYVYGRGAYDVRMDRSFSLAGLHGASLDFDMNYNALTGGVEFFNVEVSSDGGSSWTVVKHYTSDQRASSNEFDLANGVHDTASLTAFDGMSNLILRYRYASAATNAFDWWIQVDNVRVQAVPEPATFAALGLGALALLRRRK